MIQNRDAKEQDKEAEKILAENTYMSYRPTFRKNTSGEMTGRFAAQIPSSISSIAKKVGLKTRRMSGVSSYGGATQPKLTRPRGYATQRKMVRRTPAAVDL